MRYKIMVWGLGRVTRILLRSGYLDEAEIIGFIDSDPSTFAYSGGRPTWTPERGLPHLPEVDYVLVPVSNPAARQSIYRQATELGYSDSKLLFVHNSIMRLELGKIHAQDDTALRDISPRFYEEQVQRAANREKGKHLTFSCEADDWDEKRIVGKGILPDDAHYVLDYERFRTFELSALEIQRRGVEGATAELGVYRGVFSRLIHAQMPDRRHYMYDSFQSFRPEEIEDEINRGINNKAFWEGVKDTSAAIAMQGMPAPENCVIRQGFFPESLDEADKEERFAFVSIDVDMEESTYQGLRFFYPRMMPGGFIFMHDYNAPAIRNAVWRYEQDLGKMICGVHLSDCCGTLVIPM